MPLDDALGPDPVDVAIGARMRLRRKSLGISQGVLSERVGVSFQQIQKYERGANRVSGSMLVAIAAALDTTVGWLVGEEGGLSDAADEIVGALAITGIPAFKAPFEPLTPGGFRAPNTNFYRAPDAYAHDPEAFGRYCADRIAEAIEFEGPETVAAVFLSRCRTRVAASRRRPDTSNASARSATATTCCWSPTR